MPDINIPSFPTITCWLLVQSDGEIVATNDDSEKYDWDMISTVSGAGIKLLEETLQDWQKFKIKQVFIRNEQGAVILRQLANGSTLAVLSNSVQKDMVLADVEKLACVISQ